MKVLLADANAGRAQAVERGLREAGATEVSILGAGESLYDAVMAQRPDVVLVDMARPDRDSLDGVREVAAREPRPIVMFVDRDDPAFMEAAIAAGVSSYNVVGSALPEIKPIIQAAVALFRRYHAIEGRLRQAEARLEEQAVIQKAKTVLMRRQGVGEPEAHRWLRKRAMNRGKRIAEIAAEVLAEHGAEHGEGGAR